MGVGLTALAQPLVDWFTLVFGLGIAVSGARALAREKDSDLTSSSRTATTILHVTLLLGIIGCLSLILSAGLVAFVFFGDAKLTDSVWLLSIAVVLGPLTEGFRAVLRGARQVAVLATASVSTAFFGLTVSSILWWFLGIKGIPLSISGTTLLTCFWLFFSCRSIGIDFRSHSFRQSIKQALPLVQMGFWIALSAVFAQSAAIATRLTIKSFLGLEAIGYFAAAFSISGLFSNLLLAGMGTDFFPRLASAWPNRQQLGDAITEQTTLSLMMALPGLIATITFGDHLIDLLFTNEFRPAAAIIPFLAIASLIKFISWPLAYIPLVMGRSRAYAVIESTIHFLGWVFCLAGVSLFGFFGIGFAIVLQNTIGLFTSVVIASKAAGYHWPARVLLFAITAVSAALIVAAFKAYLPPQTALFLNTFVTIAVSLGSGIFLFRVGLQKTEDNPA